MTKPIRTLIACERSGTVRDAFNKAGHDAYSCDLLPDDKKSNRHYQCDVMDILDQDWDLLMVAHPPCTRLCNSGVRWLSKPPNGKTLEQMWDELREGAAFFSKLWNADIKHVAVENPIMHRHAKELIEGYQPPAQTVQPWQFGDKAFKGTSLWLSNLPPLVDTDRLTPPKAGTQAHKDWSFIHRAPPGPGRSKLRSTFFPGIAEAMANQWGNHVASKT